MLTSTIKPGLLVSMKTSVRGGVDYQRTELEPEHNGENGERVARWETKRVISDPAEYKRAIETRGKARTAIISACCQTSFGLLCPEGREAELRTAVDVARIIAAEFNASAQRSTVEVYVITGKVASNDVEAAQAIAAEVRELMSDMETGIKNADPEAIRAAANAARAIGGMLSDEAGAKVSAAIAQARAAARIIVKRVEKSGELASKVIADLSVKDIEAARFAFLDMDAAATAETVPQAAPAVDMVPATQPAAPAVNQPEIEV
jgi:hypothetical protein